MRDAAARGWHNCGRILGPANSAAQLRRHFALDLLARLCGDWFAGSGQPVLHGLSVYAATRFGATLLPAAVSLAHATAFQMDCRRSAGSLSLVIRSLQLVEQPLAHCLDCHRVLCYSSGGR